MGYATKALVAMLSRLCGTHETTNINDECGDMIKLAVDKEVGQCIAAQEIDHNKGRDVAPEICGQARQIGDIILAQTFLNEGIKRVDVKRVSLNLFSVLVVHIAKPLQFTINCRPSTLFAERRPART